MAKRKRKIRTCPLCGEIFAQESLLEHLIDTHESDFYAVASAFVTTLARSRGMNP